CVCVVIGHLRGAGWLRRRGGRWPPEGGRYKSSKSSGSQCAEFASFFASEDGCWADLYQAAQRIGCQDRDDDGESHRNRIHDEAGLRGYAEDGFAEADRENNSCCGADEAAGESEQRGFGEEKTEDSAH